MEIRNIDRIKSMDDEELAVFLVEFDECNYCSATGECTFETCEKIGIRCIREWLNKTRWD